MQNIKAHIQYYRWPILSGVLLGLTMPYFFPPLIVVALVPLFFFWFQNTDSPKRVFIAGWLTQFIMMIIAQSWLVEGFKSFTRFGWVASFLLALSVCAFSFLVIPVTGFVWAYTVRLLGWQSAQDAPLGKALLLLVSFCFLQYGLTFPFDFHLGYAWFFLPTDLSQWADLVGSRSYTALTVGINLIWTLLILKRVSIRTWIGATAGVVLVLGMFNWGGGLRRQALPQAHSMMKVLMVQSRVSPEEFADLPLKEKKNKQRLEAVDRLEKLTRQGLNEHPNVDIVIWSELSYPYCLDNECIKRFPVPKRFKDFVSSTGKPFFVGAYSADFAEGELNPIRMSNGAFVFASDGTPVNQVYRKQSLFPLGEYVPTRQSWLRQLFPNADNLYPGENVLPTEFEGRKIGFSICYEGAAEFPNARMTANGADLLVNLSSDVWFDKKLLPPFHLKLTSVRAIENRRPLIRSGKTGISAVIYPDGSIHDPSPVTREWYGVWSVPIYQTKQMTFFTRYHSCFPWFWGILLIGIILVLALKRFSRIKTPKA